MGGGGKKERSNERGQREKENLKPGPKEIVFGQSRIPAINPTVRSPPSMFNSRERKENG